MEHYKTTHETDWRRVKWIHDEEYDPVVLTSGGTEAETQEAIDVELAGLRSGALVVLGALVEVKCPHCKFWQDSDSLWGIVVDSDEDLEAWGTENLSIPEAPKAPETVGCDNVSERAQFHLDVARLIPLSKRAQDYVKAAAETPPEEIPPPPEGPSNILVREDDTSPSLDSFHVEHARPKRRLPKKVRACIEAALKRADSELRADGCGVNAAAQEDMRLYLDTWVAGPLKSVLEWDDGNPRAYLDWD